MPVKRYYLRKKLIDNKRLIDGTVASKEVALDLKQYVQEVIDERITIDEGILSSADTLNLTGGTGVNIPLDYQAWINGNLAGVYDGAYQYTVRGTAVNYPVVITGAKLRRQSNNNLLATLSARSNNWIRATVNGTNEVVNLYQFGNTWVGKNAAGQFVTLKKL